MFTNIKKSCFVFTLTLLAPTLVLGGDILSVNDAFTLASREEIILLDIRSESEWKETGIASVARSVSMHESQFLSKFKTIVNEANGRPIALICATGGRTAWLVEELSKRGISNLVDVTEGMMGSAAGPGWLRSGLPIKAYTATPPTLMKYTFWERITGLYKPLWIKEQ